MSPRPVRKTPGELTSAWPEEPSSDPVAEIARQVVLNLVDALGDRSLREVGELTGVDRTTLAEFIDGNRWPDLATIARLEIGLSVSLWPPFRGEPKGRA